MKVGIDRLMEMCKRHAESMAEQWYQDVTANSRTSSFKSLSKEVAIRHATNIYKKLGEMFFAQDCYSTVDHILDVDGFVEDFFARGLYPDEILYSIVLLRRRIWLRAESEALFRADDLYDMNAAIESINRILLITDYTEYIVTRKYRELLGKQIKILLK